MSSPLPNAAKLWFVLIILSSLEFNLTNSFISSRQFLIPSPDRPLELLVSNQKVPDSRLILATSSDLEIGKETEVEPQSKFCSVKNVEKYARLPVWPVWSGVLYFLLDQIGLRNVSCFLEDRFGGRVCPMIMDPYKTDPFILMVHHRHSFSFGDPIRYISRLLLPEGFPAHPHRGFETVTYVLKGSMTHRDSMGVKQTYGEGSVQWLTAGQGILHEEMWDLPNTFGTQQIELYQIWVNLPSSMKMGSPKIQLLGTDGDREIPQVSTDGVKVRVIAGETLGIKSQAETATDLGIFHATIQPGSEWVHRLGDGHATCFMYCQQGGVKIVAEDGALTECPVHHTAFLAGDGNAIKMVNSAAGTAEVILLSGAPISEAIVAQGSMVMNTNEEIQLAYADFYNGAFGPMWDQNLSDDDWIKLIRQWKKQ